MVCLPSLLSLPPAMSPVTRIDLMLKNNLYGIQILSHCMELRRDPSVQALSCSHQCVLELHEYPSKCFGILAVLEHRLVTFFINVLKPLLVRELSRSFVFKGSQQFWIHRILTNFAVNFSHILIIMTHQSHRMTNFEIAVERDFLLNDRQARIPFHFLS